jgi:hypothetical protein
VSFFAEPPLSRRRFLEQSALGFGAAALQGLLADEAAAAPRTGGADPLAARLPHFAPRAKSVILLFQNGGPSQMDLFDPKPTLQRLSGQKAANIRGGNGDTEQSEPLMGSAFRFRPHGESGIPFSELVPRLGSIVDDLSVVQSMYSTDPNHPGATYMMCSGSNRPGRPTLGAWTLYALGSENRNLPGFVVLRDPAVYHSGGAMQVHNGWLPAVYRATEIRAEGTPVLNLRPGTPLPHASSEENRALIARLNGEHQRRYPDESVLNARIANYELAARMQLHASDDLDLGQESAETRALYGVDHPVKGAYARRVLLARRLVERGVRFVQVLGPGTHSAWDHHDYINEKLPRLCGIVDQPSAALIIDLKRRGLLDETLVIWTGEFGRLPTSQRGHGRNHNPHGFSLLLAGGGVRGGYVHGATDELGYAAVEKRMSVPDLFATVMHLLGLDHARVSFRHHGAEENITDARVNHARVVRELLA